jgi:FlaA1/EpsC-like NDP-sugar epimerase
VKSLLHARLRLASRSWRRIGFQDVVALVLPYALLGAALSLVLLVVGPFVGVPRSVPLLDTLITIALMATARVVARGVADLRLAVPSGTRKRVMVIGAGEAGGMVVRELLRHPEIGMNPVAFLDDDPTKQGQRVSGVPVVGRIDAAGRVVDEHAVDEVLIAMPSGNGVGVRRVLAALKEARVSLPYKIVPGMFEVISGKVDVRRIREVEIEDLLGRAPVRLDTSAILGYLNNRTVLVTGAGGSIGSELVRQVCRFKPKEIILFGHGENSVYALERELDRTWPGIRYRSVIAAIQNRDRLDYVFATYRPDVVFHAAAHKHVPLMELNPEEAVFNNVVGSRNLIDMAVKYGVSHFVNISTDKAIHPTSVMGATKRVVELLVQEAASRAAPEQVFVSVRFGNVLGSRGSVIPLFKSQIEAGGPVTVTHPDMVRYFMTIPEASQLVLQASGQGRNGDVYILDMGAPVNIFELARDVIRLSGFEPDIEIPIVITGTRPGEKLFEELMTAAERTNRTSHEKIYVANVEPVPTGPLFEAVAKLQSAARVSDHLRIRTVLEEFIEGCVLDGVPRTPPVGNERPAADEASATQVSATEGMTLARRPTN